MPAIRIWINVLYVVWFVPTIIHLPKLGSGKMYFKKISLYLISGVLSNEGHVPVNQHGCVCPNLLDRSNMYCEKSDNNLL